MTDPTTRLPEWKQLVEVAKEWGYGTVHSHGECASIMGLEYPGRRYMSMMQKAKDILLMDHQRLLRAIPGEGYWVVMPDHMIDEMMGFYRAGVRRVEKSVVVGMQTPVSLLSPEKVSVCRAITDHYCRTLILMKGKQAEGAEIMKLLKKSPKIELTQ